MQFVQCHAVAPDGCPALHDHQRAAGDSGQRGQRLGGGDGRGDGDGVDYGTGRQVGTFLARVNVSAIDPTSSELDLLGSRCILAICWSFSPSIILQL